MKKITRITALFMILCLFVMPFFSIASFPADYDALIYDSTYFKDRGFDTASAMIDAAKKKNSQSYILVFYSRYDSASKVMLPQIQDWAEENQRLVNGIDQHNRYTAEYGYFNAKTSFVGWDSYISRINFSFPAVFVYNSDTRVMTAESGVSTIDRFKAIIEKAGVGQTHYHDMTAAEKQANQLNSLDLFMGTGNSYELDRAPLRIEALIMLIRLLGKEQEALILNLPHPFADVPKWASPYVGYAYKNGLTVGISETQFGSGSIATSAQYLTFFLRALGYSSETDFDWYDPYALALQAGMLPDGANINEFLRADMVMITKSALTAKMKGTTTTLGEKLVSLYSIGPEQYKAVTDLAASYTSVQKEFATDTWQNYVRVEPKSPEYAVTAIKEVSNYTPAAIYMVVEPGYAGPWVKYIESNLTLDKRLIKSFTVTCSDSLILIEFEYGAAARLLSHLFLKGYESSSVDETIARMTKTYIDKLTELTYDSWITEYLNTCTVISDEEAGTVYNDADAAIAIQMSTPDGIENARLLLKKAFENRDKIILD